MDHGEAGVAVRMPTSGGQNPVVARYGCLFETLSASDATAVRDGLGQIDIFLQEHPRVFHLLSFGLPARTVGAVLDALGQRLSLKPVTRAFLRLFAQNGHTVHLPALVSALNDLGLEVVHLVSAVRLSEKAIQARVDQLKAHLNAPIRLVCHHDPGLLGGERLFWRSKMLDTSLASALDAFQKQVVSL